MCHNSCSMTQLLCLQYVFLLIDTSNRLYTNPLEIFKFYPNFNYDIHCVNAKYFLVKIVNLKTSKHLSYVINNFYVVCIL